MITIIDFFNNAKSPKYMANKTLKDFYEEQKKMPTPADEFVAKLCEVTHRREVTVRGWISGKFRPDINTQIVLAQFLRTDASSLFPPQNC